MDKVITVLTPTFNRASTLPKLYSSLKNQDDKSFIWLIVDDGSTDNTKLLIQAFIDEKKIDILYLHKNNGGKHTALNLGISNVVTPLTFIVDSDDWLECNAISTISFYYLKYKNNFEICGFSFLRKYSNGNINGKMFKKDFLIDSYINVRVNNSDMNADKAEVFFTRCLQEFPFPVYGNEKFLGEDIVWAEMSKKYKMVHINQAFYLSEYLQDGLTTNRRIHNIHSPIGCMNRANVYLGSSANLKFKIKCTMQYLIYGWFANVKSKELQAKSNNKFLTILLFLPSKMIYHKWKKENLQNV